MKTSYHLYKNNPNQIGEVRGKFIGVSGDLNAHTLSYLDTGQYIAVPHGPYSKSDGPPPIRFISVVRNDVEINVL